MFVSYWTIQTPRHFKKFYKLYLFKLVPGGKIPHTNHAPDVIDKRWREWVKNGKPEDKFDHTTMGLDMMTAPTKHFGWEEITATMKKVFKPVFYFSLCYKSLQEATIKRCFTFIYTPFNLQPCLFLIQLNIFNLNNIQNIL